MSLSVFEKFVFRVPIEPVSYLKNIIQGNLVDKSKINEKVYAEALLLASPELSMRLAKWLKDDHCLMENFTKLDSSYLKYLIRMSTRCTPFGLFAGCGVGKVSKDCGIEVNETDEFQRRLRLDMDVVGCLCQELNKREDILSYLTYHVNTSLYELSDYLRYVETRYHGNARKYQLSSVENDEFLSLIVNSAREGKKISELLKLLTDEGFDKIEALEYIKSLIDSQLLIGDLEPPVIADNALAEVLSVIKSISVLQPVESQINEISSNLNYISNHPPGTKYNNYGVIKDKLDILISNLNSKYILQGDLFVTSSKATVNHRVMDSLNDAFKVINKLTTPLENEYLKQFRKNFYERYEEEEISLVEALDTESGIGFGKFTALQSDKNGLVDDIFLKTRSPNPKIELNKVQEYLLDKYDECTKNSSIEVEINENELIGFPEVWDDLPVTMSSIVEILDKGSTKKEPLLHVNSLGGGSGANLLGRFCHLDRKLKELVDQIICLEEENQDFIHAEIAHLPESRVGNVLLRPEIREFEIPYLVSSTRSTGSVIKISDIMVSVRGGEKIVLRSKKLDKEIRLYNTTAHNFSRGSLPIYHFLSSMQNNGLRSFISFNWGPLLMKKDFLPRVRYKNIVLSLAKWNIKAEDYKNIPDVNDKNFMCEVDKFCKSFNLPNKFYLINGDNRLFIDITLPVYAKILFMEVKKSAFSIEEFLFNEKNSLIMRKSEGFTNECIFFYKNNVK